jgi:hypothetical protein
MDSMIRCQANMAHLNSHGQILTLTESGLGSQVKIPKTFQDVPTALDRGDGTHFG